MHVRVRVGRALRAHETPRQAMRAVVEIVGVILRADLPAERRKRQRPRARLRTALTPARADVAVARLRDVADARMIPDAREIRFTARETRDRPFLLRGGRRGEERDAREDRAETATRQIS